MVASAPSSQPLRAILYARVSKDTGDQDPETQLQTLRPWCGQRGWSIVAEELDCITGDPGRRRGDPAGLGRALRAIAERRADVLAVFAADRLVRSPVGLLQLVARVQSIGGAVASYQDGADLDTTTDVGELLLFVRGWMARMELRLLRARTMAGLQRARAQGRVGGRPRKVVDMVQAASLRGAGRSLEEIGQELGCSRDTVRRVLRKKPSADHGTPAVET